MGTLMDPSKDRKSDSIWQAWNFVGLGPSLYYVTVERPTLQMKPAITELIWLGLKADRECIVSC